MYYHTQRSPVSFLFFLVPATALLVAWLLRSQEPAVAVGAAIMGVILFLVASGMQTLTVFDRDDHLNVRYGPFPLFGWRFDYNDMTDATPGRTWIIDGWGIHWVPFRGWTLNLFGFECVVLHFGNKTVRIGTNDSEALVNFLKDKLARQTEGS